MTDCFGRLLDLLEFLDPLDVLALFESNNFCFFYICTIYRNFEVSLTSGHRLP